MAVLGLVPATEAADFTIRASHAESAESPRHKGRQVFAALIPSFVIKPIPLVLVTDVPALSLALPRSLGPIDWP